MDAAHSAIANAVIDHYLGVPDADWVGPIPHVKEAEGTGRGSGEEGRRPAQLNSKPALALAAYAGRYRDAWYGDMRIEEHGGKLSIHFTHTPDLVGELEHWQYDTFVARWKKRTLDADAYVTFSLKPDGTIDEVADEGGIAADGFQLRFPGSAVPSGSEGLAAEVGPGTRPSRIWRAWRAG